MLAGAKMFFFNRHMFSAQEIRVTTRADFGTSYRDYSGRKIYEENKHRVEKDYKGRGSGSSRIIIIRK